MKDIINKLRKERERKQNLMRFREIEDNTLREKLLKDEKTRFELYYKEMSNKTLKEAVQYIMEKERDIAFDLGYFWALENIEEQIK